MNRRDALISALATIPALGAWRSAAAQPIERPTECEEVLASGNIFIGHNCGEFASILIVGRIIIRRPWSRVNRASRAERLRRRRASVPAAETETPAAAETPAPAAEPRGEPPLALDLSCDDFEFQEDAQEYFDQQGWSETNDPFGLDQGGVPGVPCEDLPSRRG